MKQAKKENNKQNIMNRHFTEEETQTSTNIQ